MLPPKNGKPIIFKPTQQLREQTEAIADSQGLSLSDYVRKAVECYNAQQISNLRQYRRYMNQEYKMKRQKKELKQENPTLAEFIGEYTKAVDAHNEKCGKKTVEIANSPMV